MNRSPRANHEGHSLPLVANLPAATVSRSLLRTGLTAGKGFNRRNRRSWLICAGLLLTLLTTMQLSLLLGHYALSFDELCGFFWRLVTGQGAMEQQRDATIYSLLFDIRLPRILAAVLIGAALAVAGGTFQALFVNPLVSPGILGVLSGASFGAALGMVLHLSWLGVQLSAFVFGSLAVATAAAIALIYRHSRSSILLILGGMISSSLFTALLSVLKYTADPYDSLPAIVYWLMGSLSLCDRHSLMLLSLPMLVSIGVLCCLAKHLNAMSLGDEEAQALGIQVRRVRLVAISLATLSSALCVVLAGVVGWIGLIIPHMARFLLGADNRAVLPASALMGALFLLLADNLSRTLFPYEIPIGILTALVGIPVFIIVMKHAQEGGQ